MNVSVKALLDLCKSINEDFRHEFNGETWNVWTSRDDYPQYQGVTTEYLIERLTALLRGYRTGFFGERARANKQIERINAVIGE